MYDSVGVAATIETMNVKPFYPGKVILASAGPGDPDLITVKALRYLQQADVVITDRLVSEELLIQNMKAGAELIYVGKQAGQQASTPQEEINQLLVEQAKQHQLIVRLKGGDVTFFSNVLDELSTLVKHGISFEIVPGVTAASGAAAYAGIPLTARGYATGVRFLHYNRAVVGDETSWGELASTNDTLVFYMSTEWLSTLIDKLLDNHISPDKYLLVIEQATTPFQNARLFNLKEDRDIIAYAQFVSPTLVIIGKVVALHKEFQWIENNPTDRSYFKSVNDRKANVLNNHYYHARVS
jgi:uroporphyrin-III C-methyltransferase